MADVPLIDRELIWSTLYAVVKQALGSAVVTCGRRHIIPPALTPEQQPACFVLQGPEKTVPKPQSKKTLQGFLVFYINNDQTDQAAGQETQLSATVLNSLLALIDSALQPDNVRTQFFTLGGLVQHCWIEGTTHVEVDLFGSQGYAAVPINMLVP